MSLLLYSFQAVLVQLYVGIPFFETWEGKEEEGDFKKGLVGIPLSPPPSLPPGGAKGRYYVQ